MREFAALRTKTYSYLTYDSNENEKSTVKKICHKKRT